MTIELEPMIPAEEDIAIINQITQDNPDLSYEFVRQLLIAQAEINTGKVEPFEFGKI